MRTLEFRCAPEVAHLRGPFATFRPTTTLYVDTLDGEVFHSILIGADGVRADGPDMRVVYVDRGPLREMIRHHADRCHSYPCDPDCEDRLIETLTDMYGGTTDDPFTVLYLVRVEG